MVPFHALNSLTKTQAIPRITSDFHSLTDVGWYGTAYLLSKFVLTFEIVV
jgi:hypothetical protein